MITFQQETVETVETDIVPLMKAHNEEVRTPEVDLEFPLNVNVAMYKRLAAAGVLRIFTARDDARLVGYATFIVGPSHHRDMICAHEDALYVTPDFRKGRLALKLIHYAEEVLKPLCDLVIYHCPTSKPHFGVLLEKLGYKPYATYFARRM